jgi:uncharacterized protein YlaI
MAHIPKQTKLQLNLAKMPERQRRAAVSRAATNGHTPEYEAYLTSREWKSRKDRYFSTHAKKCEICNKKTRIHAHHLSYEKLGNEPDSDLMPLCHDCHNKVHEYHAGLKDKTLREATYAYLKLVKSVQIKHRIKVQPGTEFSIVGERGRFRFLGAEISDSGKTVLNFIGGAPGHEAFRSFYPERVKRVHRINRTRENAE